MAVEINSHTEGAMEVICLPPMQRVVAGLVDKIKLVGLLGTIILTAIRLHSFQQLGDVPTKPPLKLLAGYGLESYIDCGFDIVGMNKAELYSTAHSLQIRDASAVLDEFIGALSSSPGEKVLDVGCGPGYVTAHVLLPRLLPAGLKYLLGVDISPHMVRHAREKYVHHSLVFEQLDIARDVTSETRSLLLQGDEEGFHKVFSFYCLHWVPDQRLALANIMKILRPGGEALLVFLASCPIFSMYESMASKPNWSSYMQEVSRFVSPYQHSTQPARQLEDLLEDLGFKVKHCECRPRSFEYTSSEALIDSINAVNPFLDNVPEELQAEFTRDCVAESIKLTTPNSCNNGNGKRSLVRYNLLIAHVKKS